MNKDGNNFHFSCIDGVAICMGRKHRGGVGAELC